MKSEKQLWAQYKRILKTMYPKMRFYGNVVGGWWDFYDVYPEHDLDQDKRFLLVRRAFNNALKQNGYIIGKHGGQHNGRKTIQRGGRVRQQTT